MRQKGFTTMEVLLASSIFMLMTGVIFFALRQSTQVFNQVDGNFDALTQLRRASSWLSKDLRRASPTTYESKRVSTGGGGHGNAIWMLSSEGDDGVHVRDADGVPIYQKNVLYYLVRPDNHDRVSHGVVCTIDDTAHPDGDPFCAHKILIRKEIRREPDPSEPETLLSQAEIDSYLTLPDGFDLSGMTSEYGTPGVKDGAIRVVGNALLSLEIDQNNLPFVRLIFRAVRINESRKEIPGFGSVVLDTLPQTLEVQYSVLPSG